MTHRFLVRLHVWLVTILEGAGARLRTAPQGGQGTVEYVALILLVAGAMAAAVGAVSKGAGFDTLITKELKDAVGKVSR